MRLMLLVFGTTFLVLGIGSANAQSCSSIPVCTLKTFNPDPSGTDAVGSPACDAANPPSTTQITQMQAALTLAPDKVQADLCKITQFFIDPTTPGSSWGRWENPLYHSTIPGATQITVNNNDLGMNFSQIQDGRLALLSIDSNFGKHSESISGGVGSSRKVATLPTGSPRALSSTSPARDNAAAATRCNCSGLTPTRSLDRSRARRRSSCSRSNRSCRTRSSSFISARARASRSASFSSKIARAIAAPCPRPIPFSASRLVMRSSITWPTEPSCSRMVSVFRTNASSAMSASRRHPQVIVNALEIFKPRRRINWTSGRIRGCMRTAAPVLNPG
jgi:hypothetical protein